MRSIWAVSVAPDLLVDLVAERPDVDTTDRVDATSRADWRADRAGATSSRVQRGSRPDLTALVDRASRLGQVEVGTDDSSLPVRFVRVPEPGQRWPEVVASLLDGFDVVVVHPPPRRTARDDQAVRRLSARTRERGAVLVSTAPWEGSALGLAVTAQRWHGLGRGHGHLAAREVVVSAVGRGSAVRPRRTRLWLPAGLPATDGGIVTAATGSELPVAGDPYGLDLGDTAGLCAHPRVQPLRPRAPTEQPDRADVASAAVAG